jgi:hypothetical protein
LREIAILGMVQLIPDDGRGNLMPIITLEDRLTAVEHELGELKQRLDEVKAAPSAHKWVRIFGSFAGSEGFDEAVRLGREYRESLQPGGDGEPV